MDVGDLDNLRAGASQLHDVFRSYGFKHDFEIYPGNHTNNMAVRFRENVIPFFSRTLSFDR